jgi:hypothetical protein
LERELLDMAKSRFQQRWGPPETWPDYYLVRARLTVAVTLLRRLLEPSAGTAEYLAESALVDPDTVLWGIPDLVVRSPDLHAVVDYKTGRAHESESGQVRDTYSTQMHLYAYLEFKVSGEWPTRTLILSLEEGLVDIETGPQISLKYIDSALKTVAAYNDAVPATPPASPSARVCRYCRFVSRCDPFWQAAPEVASDGYTAVRGTIERIKSTPLGGYTIEVQASPESGFIAPALTIRRVDPVVHPIVAALEPGDAVCVTNLYIAEQERSINPEWRLGSLAELIRIDGGW